jgi:hypothetical protein
MPDKAVGSILNDALPLLNRDVHRKKSSQVDDRPDPQPNSGDQQQICHKNGSQTIRPVQKSHSRGKPETDKAAPANENPDKPEGSTIAPLARITGAPAGKQKDLHHKEPKGKELRDPEYHLATLILPDRQIGSTTYLRLLFCLQNSIARH